MFLNNFFSISKIDPGEVSNVEVVLNADHIIFQGHFPGMPVVPGVCLLQMFKEVLEKLCERELQLFKETNMKFMAVLNPKEHPRLNFELKYNLQDDDTIAASGSLTGNDIKFFSTKSIYKIK